MARYYFDVDDGHSATADDVGRDLRDPALARQIALQTLPGLVQDRLPDGEREIVTVRVRDGTGRDVCVAMLSLVAVDL